MRKTSKRWTACLLSLVLFLLPTVLCVNKVAVQALSEGDFYVNSEWTYRDDVTSEHTAKETLEGGAKAYKTAFSTIADSGIKVTATFMKTEGRPDGVSYLSDNGFNQSAYGVTSDMLYGNPTPASIPALGIDVQPGSSIYPNAELTEDKLKKMNLSGIPMEEGILTFTFDHPVTDPILDLSGLGGFTQASAEYYMYNPNTGLYDDGPYNIARTSFNSTDLEVLDANITPVIEARNSNLMIENKIIKVINRNTHTRAYVDLPNGYATHDYGLRGPTLEPAGCGSIILKGTFNEVSIKLYHVATPYSAFPTAQYGTSELYFHNSGDWGPQYGDGINGLNVLISEKFMMADEVITGRQQNLDLFRASIRLQKPSSIGDFVWQDKNHNGIQDPGEPGLDGVTVKLLDENGQPATDYKGETVATQTTANGGLYKFDNLAAGKYYVEFVLGENQGFSEQEQGTDSSLNSDVDPSTGRAQIILEPNSDRVDIDAGIVNLYKVTHEFISGTDGKELPQEVKELTPGDQTGKKNGETVTPTAPSKTTVDVEGGTWTFVSYDRENDVINQADAHFIGKWVFEEKQAENGNVYVKYITEDGQVLEAESAVKTNAPDGEAYTTEKKTFPGYEFVKMGVGSAPANGKVLGGQNLYVTYVYRAVKGEPQPSNSTENKPPHYIIVPVEKEKVTVWTPQPTSTKVVLQPGKGSQVVTQMPSMPRTGEQGVPVAKIGVLAAASVALMILRKKLGR